MNVPSMEFFGFALVAAVLFNLGPAGLWRRCILLITNLVFFLSFTHAPLALLPFVAFLLLGFVGLRLIQSGQRRAFVPFLLATLVAFVWLKRYTFFPAGSFLPFAYLTIGLSYVFFRVMHLLIDASGDELPGRVSVLSYVNYTLNFTALIAGPIQRYQDYHASEVEAPAPLDIVVVGGAVERIVIGFFKVAIVSAIISGIQHSAIAALDTPLPLLQRAWTAMLVVGAYPLFLYANFSGYCDVVIGVARFFRLVLPENFDHPFASFSFIEFWSRWHITLSTWLKTYVYNPLLITSMRRFPSRGAERFLGVFAFFVTFFLVGVWHGQTSEFLAFGLLQGGGVAANKLYQLKMVDWLGRKPYRALAARPWYRIGARGLTFTWFAFTLLWFWSDWGAMAKLAASTGPAASVLAVVAFFVLASALLTVAAFIRARLFPDDARPRFALHSRYVRTAWATALVVVIMTTTFVLDAPAPDIVYKTF